MREEKRQGEGQANPKAIGVWKSTYFDMGQAARRTWCIGHPWVRQSPVSRVDLRVRQLLLKLLHPTLRDLSA